MMSPVKRATRLTALPLAAALLLSACGGTGTREGVVVGDTSYSVEEVQEAAAHFRALSGQEVSPQAVASVAASVPVLDDYFGGSSYAITEGEVREQLRGGGLEDEATELTLDVARYQYYASVLNDPAAQQDPALIPVMERMANYPADLAALDVEINPRFGTWDPANGGVVPQVPSWIAQPDAS